MVDENPKGQKSTPKNAAQASAWAITGRNRSRFMRVAGWGSVAVVFKQSNPVLLAHEDGRDPLLHPVVDRFKRLFRSDADDERSFSYGPGRC